MRAVLFPGQGSQYVGMGSDFYKQFQSVKKNFEIVDKTLGFSLSSLILNGPEAELKLTRNTQPAIMVVGVSIFNVLNQICNLNLKDSKFFAGHSLGEYTALVCAGSLSIERAAYLLHERGKAMQEAVPEGRGAMIAVLGMKIDEVEEEINLLPKEEICEIANDNSNSQVVASGTTTAIEILSKNLKKKKKKGIVLPVSAPFHSSLMKKASGIMKNKIESTDFLKPKPSIISNVTAKKEDDISVIKSLLVGQITSRVRWRESVSYMIKEGVVDFVEIGPGKVLSSLVKKIDSNAQVSNINSLDDIKK
ncbi:MAG: ACP S-malonyltransferase [Pelagibacteraceae bacterium]|jgi:[acyl-carrier-protein] S-malonyltransferase|nr:[acyl-carrier-protein] S-malonyltransferase [Candidatus Pelagibacter sp.]MDP6680945.1 ACP S-malonyltransferase [Pelagibacteraceae bacterium]|tara:strand:+ start:332 stop:1249 length:918 start_codon:yes stop_codon:yes gene_type:complete